MTRIAFPLVGGRAGTGIFNYLLNAARALSRHAAGRLTPLLLIGKDVGDSEVAQFAQVAGVEIAETGRVSVRQDNAQLLSAIAWGIDAAAVTAARKSGADVMFETASFYGWRLPIPVVAWIPDFQHRRLPGFFNRWTLIRRELGVLAQTAGNRLVMLSSEDARRDCETFYPQTIGRTAVVKFAAMIEPSLLLLAPAEVVTKYGLPRTFFFLPNQFWKHKNHEVVIDALRIIRNGGGDVTVAVTGVTADPRHPAHFEQLMARVAIGGLERNFRYLGVLPKEEVFALMRACRALINPSYSEGWSTSVEEAKSLGVPLLLSDLPSHREQVGRAASYFAPASASQLADLIMSLEAISQPERQAAEAVALMACEARVSRFADDFCTTVERAISVASGQRARRT